MSVLIDSYASSNVDHWHGIYEPFEFNYYAGQSFTTTTSRPLSQGTFVLGKYGSPTGSVSISVYSHYGTYGVSGSPQYNGLLATSDTIDIASLPSLDSVTFTFSGGNKITLNADTHYFLLCKFSVATSDVNNYIKWGTDDDSPTASGNYYVGIGPTYNNLYDATKDMPFYVYGDNISSTSSSESPSISPSLSPSISQSPSKSPSQSPSYSPSVSVSPSLSPSVSESPSKSPSVSPSLSPSVSVSPSLSPSVSISPSQSPSLSPSVSMSPSLSPSVSISPSLSPSVSVSPSISPSMSPSLSPSVSVSPSLSPSVSMSPSLSPSVSVSPSLSPSVSMSPSLSPSVSMSPSKSPSLSPSVSMSPSQSPSLSPSVSVSPSVSPSIVSSSSVSPSQSPSLSPSVSVSPSLSPSVSVSPSLSPSVSISPSLSPSVSISPSISPSLSPSISVSPSISPSVSVSPSQSPSISPSLSPSVSVSPSQSPSISPSLSPSVSVSPSISPSVSVSPSQSPSVSPSISPSVSVSPSQSPSYSPSVSVSPSLSPSVSPSVSPSESQTNHSEIYIFNPGDNTWISQKLDLVSNSKIEFCTFLDGVFECNFSDDTRYYDGTSWNLITNVTNTPRAKYVINYNDRLYLAYLDITGTTHSCRVLPSSLPDLTTYAITWDTSATGPAFDVSPLDGDVITGLGKNFNRLLIFKEKGLWKYDTNTLYQYPGAPGTNNNRSIQNVLDYTLYFHTTGVYGLQGDTVSLLSRAIKPIIDGVQSVNLDKICSYSSGDHYYLFLHDVINEEWNINIKNCLVDLDVARMRWSVQSLAHTPRVFGTYRNNRTEITYDDADINYDYVNQTYDGYTSAQDFIYFGDDQGDVYQLDTSYDFAGTAISSYFETVNYYPAGIDKKGELQALKVYTEKGRRCKFFYSIDDGPWKPIVRYEYRGGEIYYTFPSGLVINRIKLRCVDNSTGDRPAIKGFDFFYTNSYEI